MSKDDDCIFCKIANGELPSSRVYDSDDVIAFLDINPVASGHTLVVPRRHCVDQLDAEPAVLEAIARALPRIARAVQEATGAEGFNLIQCNGAAAGQEVFHLHYHIIPRRMGDGAMAPWRHVSYEEGEAARIAESIRSNIRK